MPVPDGCGKNWLAEYAHKGVTPDRVCVTAGVQEGLYALFYVLLDEKRPDRAAQSGIS